MKRSTFSTTLLAAIPAFFATTPLLAAEPLTPPLADNTKVCLKESLTGSRIATNVCRTLKEWEGQMSSEEMAALRRQLEARRQARLAENSSQSR